MQLISIIQKVIYIIPFVLYAATAYSQKPVFKHYTTEDGLPHDITYQIIQDKQGVIWIGTDDGLTKFNGIKFTNYSYENGLQSNYVIDIIEKSNNAFLIATWGSGIHSLKNDSITKLPIKHDEISKIKKLYALNDSIIYSSSNSAYFSYNLNLNEKKQYHIGENELTQNPIIYNRKPADNEIIYGFSESFIQDTLYLFSNEASNPSFKSLKGLYFFTNNKLSKLNYPNLNDIEVHSVTKKNDSLFASSFNTVFVYKKDKLIYERFLGLKRGKIISSQIDNNNLYFIFLNKLKGTRELYRYDLDNNILNNISSKLGINSMVSDFLFDRDTNLWITTYGKGVYYLPNFSNSFFDKDFFSNPDLKDITSINGHILTIAPNTLYQVENDSLKNKKSFSFHIEDFEVEKKRNKIHLISYQKNNFNTTFLKYSVASRDSKSYLFHSDSTDIRIQYNTISVFKNDTLYNTEIVHKRDAAIKKAILYNDKIYVIYNNLGVYVFDCNTGEKISLLDKANGFFTNQFNDIIIKNNIIWLASNMGVIKITKNEKIRYTTKNGLISNHINDLLIDSHGILWAATQKGLNVCINTNFYTIDKNLGQQSSFITKVIEHNNYIYATGNNGLFKLNNLHPFTPKLNTELIIKQQEHQFSLNAINYINPNSLIIAYQLDQNPWIETTNELLVFETIKQGKHTIKFKCKDGLSNWSYTKSYYFKIVLPWHKQVWFYILITVLLLGSVVVFTYYLLQKSISKNKTLKNTISEREKLRNELNQVRANVAQDFHDELGNKLASISVLSNLLSQKTNLDTQLHKKVLQINKDAKALYSGMRDFVWAIDHKSDTLIELIFYLNNFGEELFENTNIIFITDNNCNTEENIILPYYWSKQLVFVFKEAMTNCLKHSKATESKLIFRLEDNRLNIYFIDNGIGYTDDKLLRKNGLLNMQKRVEKINGELQIVSNQGVLIQFIGAFKK